MQNTPKKILYVDDDEDILQIAQMTLESFGNFEVSTCNSGKLVMEAVNKFHPDLILMDVMMPEMDGESTLKNLRANSIYTPIIFVTAKVQKSEINEYIAIGGIGVIKKPFDPVQICAEIQKIWENSQTTEPAKDNGLEKLLSLYLSHLKEHQQYIAEAINSIKHKDLSPEISKELQKIAHNLNGSGATYGFNELSEAARNLEITLVDIPTDSKKILELLEILNTVCITTIEEKKTSSREKNPQNIDKQHILLIDDDEETVEQLKNIFSEKNQLTRTIDREQIFSLLEKKSIDLILLNNHSPNIDALRLLETLQAIPAYAEIQVILLVPEAETNTVMPYIMAGAVDYVTKPLQVEMVQEKIIARLEKINTAILIVDDDVTIRELLAHKFRSIGCQVLQAQDGEEALNMMGKKAPDLIILDYMMPGIDGGAVLQKMHRSLALTEVPVLLLTAKRQEENILAGFKLGASDYITKPFIPDEVVVRSFNLLKSQKKIRNV